MNEIRYPNINKHISLHLLP